MFLTLAVGGAAWVATDQISSKALRHIFEERQKEQILVDAAENRVNFDLHARKFISTAKLLASMRAAEEYARKASADEWARPDVAIRMYDDLPPWMPKNSLLRTMAPFKYALLLDESGATKEIYRSVSALPGPELTNPSQMLFRLSLDQCCMTYLDGEPYIISSSLLPLTEDGSNPALMIASPIDSDYLNATLQEHRGNRIVALLSLDKPRVIASSNEKIVPVGLGLEALEENFMKVSKSYLDYGSSDLRVEFATLAPMDAYNAVIEEIMKKEAIYRSASGLALFLVFITAMVWVTQRVNSLSTWVNDAAEEMLGERNPSEFQGDELVALENLFKNVITDLKASRNQLDKANQHMLEMSRLAGMAEASTGVLHNVGNALNSVNVSAGLVMDILRGSRLNSLHKATLMIREHLHDLDAFLKKDDKGRHFPDFLLALADRLKAEQEKAFNELATLLKSVEHIKEIIAVQQDLAKTGGFKTRIAASELIEDALRIAPSTASRKVKVDREFADAPEICVDKQKAVQVLVNLIKNAEQAMEANPDDDRTLLVRLKAQRDKGKIIIDVEDNGEGIPPENLSKIFAHGFSTKKDGHGFGLHMSALAAKEMGGSLKAKSNGPGLGAVFTFELPAQSLETEHE